MKLSKLHVKYWRERQREPEWVDAVFAELSHKQRFTLYKTPRHEVTIDQIVNTNAQGMASGRNTEAQNVLSILRLAARNGGLRECLERMARNHYGDSSKRRIGYARKWLGRIQKEVLT